jgi:hypothetical protein
MVVPRPPIETDNPAKQPPPEDVVVEKEAEVLSSGGYQGDTDISNKEFRYNPPMHKANLLRRAYFGEDVWDQIYDEKTAPRDYKEKWAAKNLNSLRLGRIIQHHLAPGQASTMKYRWGFRFLYNPTTVTTTANREDSFVIDPRSETNRVLSGVNQNFQTIGISLLLDRVPDVMSQTLETDAYSPSLRSGDKAGLRRYGTHWDLEALFRICNGEWNLTDRGKTSNIGVLTPSNARLVLGPGNNHYGFVMNVSYQDIMFSDRMVPIRTMVNINFRRHVDMSAEQAEVAFPGIASSQEGASDSEVRDTGSVGSSAGGGSEALASFFLERVGDTQIIGKATVDGPATYHSVYRACIKNVTFAKRYIGDSVRWTGYATADAVRKRVAANGGLRSGYDAPAGALYWWNAGVGDGAGHVAVSDGRGNAINNWGGARIEKLAVRNMSPSHYSGWSTYASL